MSIQFVGVQKFNADIDRFAREVELDLRTVVRRLALEIFTGIVMRTPVDKGFARAGWLVGINSEPPDPQVDTSGEGPGEDGANAANRQEMGKIDKLRQPFSLITIVNHLPYIEPLEKGSSSKAPQGMVAVTLAEQASFLRSFGAL